MEKKHNHALWYTLLIALCLILGVKYWQAAELTSSLEGMLNAAAQEHQKAIEEFNTLHQDYEEIQQALIAESAPLPVRAETDVLSELIAQLDDGDYAVHRTEDGGLEYCPIPAGYLADKAAEYCAASYEPAKQPDAAGQPAAALDEDDCSWWLVRPDCVAGFDLTCGFISAERGTSGETLIKIDAARSFAGAFFNR
ncbi:MAG: hypothetical protein ACOYIE_06385 [Agathobaculum sp.]|jgi:hypothetical protein|uniref:hypothetical protein n=1 Tax=Agathobaculum sp. TaxID=2048138 RepID=UPI003D8A0EEE